MTMSDDGDRTCPLCAEEMDITDQQLKPCKCGYEVPPLPHTGLPLLVRQTNTLFLFSLFCLCVYAALQICVWCWHHIIDMAEKEDTEGRCPACRTRYDKDRIVKMAAATCDR
jgi:CCR4-NOT transcription complex subunit 4